MRYMMLYKPGRGKNAQPGKQDMAAVGSLLNEMANKGVLLDNGGLQPSSKGARIRMSGGKVTVDDGPFAEEKELVTGYAIVQADSKTEAIEYAKRMLQVRGEGESEIRPLLDWTPPGVTPAMERTGTRDEAQIRTLIDGWTTALCAKDLNRMMTYYAKDIVLFDVKPPYQLRGVPEVRRVWEECLPMFPASFGVETRNLTINVSGDCAHAHWLAHFTSKEKDHPATQTWIRVTTGYRKDSGQWKIVHEHVSIPFDPETSQVVYTLNP